MKITIAGSMVFAKDILRIKNDLEKTGHSVLTTDDIDHYVRDNSIKNNFEEELRLSKEYDIIRSFFNKIAESDAMLIVNNEKKGISGYLGTNVIMEIGVAYFLKKKIFLLNPIDKNQPYTLEIAMINPLIINGDLSKIK
ncbi:MAG: hypothetical protein WC080_02415 [Patescibacteria group bacterium]|jgi:2-phosphoglycerate kinase